MSGDDPLRLAQPEAAGRRRWPSAVWLVPAVAALIALGLLAEHLTREGPTITIAFASGEGLEAGKTPVKYKDVTIGMVTAVRLSKDYDAVEVEARIARSAAGMMKEGADFWIVRPRFSLSQISGLGTLFSGNYIAFDRSDSSRDARRFAGRENPKAVTLGMQGRQYRLQAVDAQQVQTGQPVYYRGLEVGQVMSYAIAGDGKGVDVSVFVKAPYDAYVRPTTRFWTAGGLDVSVSGAGFDVRTESLVSMLIGGLAFDDGPGAVASDAPAADGAAFALYRDRATAMKQPDPRARRYVLLFDESLDGLAVGAPVTVLGVRVGEVTALGLKYDEATARMRGRVEVTFSPERFIAVLPEAQARHADLVEQSAVERNAIVRRLLRAGLRGRLVVASYLTGQRSVDFAYFASHSRAEAKLDRDPPELPVVPSTLPTIERRVVALLDKLDALPLSDLAAGLRDALRESRATLSEVSRLARNVDDRALPGLVADLDQAGRALRAAERVLDETSGTLVGPDAAGQRELVTALRELTGAARSLRALADSIERHPESLVFGRSSRPPPP